MKQVTWSIYSPDAFVFDDAYVLDLGDGAMSISHFDPRDLGKPEVIECRIRECPKIDLNVFGKHTLRGLVSLGHFSLTLAGPKVGVVKHNDKYSVCSDGAYWRRVTSTTIAGRLTKTALSLSVTVHASPVETLVESQPPGPLSSRDQAPFSFSQNFIIPIDSVGDFLDLDRCERKHLNRLVRTLNS